ncbi:MAG: NADH-quinone oxidoreductase subunit NuoG [Desulfobacterales bacterium]|jgi:NADH-quinone oxidoreductase subunit G|nr:NADH-quinone oxidoreductase subunit NuoG [Desulfobacterales bacterium]
MPRIVIDNREIDVAPGTKVIHAAEQLGIMIPRFCYHPALGSVGACRICAVNFLDGPVKGIQMSCMVNAADGMVVSTADAQAMDFRKQVVEWLMMNHPHDCPVCDEGGHCLLQEMTISGGHGRRRYSGLKRTYMDQFLGPLIQQEMNRCIHCYRCARFYQEITGYRDFGVLRIGSRTSYGRFSEGALESPFSGNLADICPTGVFTDKPARYKGRRWDFERSPSVCIHCSLGCHTVVSARYREIVRQEAGINPTVNGHFICDRGRYGFYYANLESRPRKALIEGRPESRHEALQYIFDKLKAIETGFGTQAVAGLGASRSSLETQAMLLKICRANQWREPAYFIDAALGATVKAAQSGLSLQTAVSLGQVVNADVILVVGADPVNEAPMLALELNKAHRKGANIVVMDPRPVELPFEFNQVPVAPQQLARYLGRLMTDTVTREAARTVGVAALSRYDALCADSEPLPAFWEEMKTVARALCESKHPLIICGTAVVPPTLPALSADFAMGLKVMEKASGLFYLLPGPNAYGAGLLSMSPNAFEQIIADIEADRVRALIVVESDLFRFVSDKARLSRALDRLSLLVVLDYIHSDLLKKAHVVLPVETIYEAGGVFINQEARAQMIAPVFKGGVPILQTGGGAHPPRDYGVNAAEGDGFPAWLTLACLADKTLSPDRSAVRKELWQWMRNTVPELNNLPQMNSFPPDGVRLLATVRAFDRNSFDETMSTRACLEPSTGLMLISVDRTFGTEVLSRLSPCLHALEKPAALLMNARDAERLKLADGDRITLELKSGSVEVMLCTSNHMADGVCFISGAEALVWECSGTSNAVEG